MPEAAPGGEDLAKGRADLAWERLQELWYLVDVHTAAGGDVSTKHEADSFTKGICRSPLVVFTISVMPFPRKALREVIES